MDIYSVHATPLDATWCAIRYDANIRAPGRVHVDVCVCMFANRSYGRSVNPKLRHIGSGPFLRPHGVAVDTPGDCDERYQHPLM